MKTKQKPPSDVFFRINNAPEIEEQDERVQRINNRSASGNCFTFFKLRDILQIQPPIIDPSHVRNSMLLDAENDEERLSSQVSFEILLLLVGNCILFRS